MRPVLLSLVFALLIPIAPAGPEGAAAAVPATRQTSAHQARKPMPKLKITRMVNHVDHPWDVQADRPGRLLFTQRDRAPVGVKNGGTPRAPSRAAGLGLRRDRADVLEVDPDFASNGRFYTLPGRAHRQRRPRRARLAWRLNAPRRGPRPDQGLVGGFPTSSGRHGGCRLLITRDGSLLVGTGDAAVGTNPREPHSLGGKTLRLDRFTGAPWPANPFVHAQQPPQRYVQTYGHRNVQGLAQRGDGTLWSVEQGTYRDDEVNLLVNGGDYGYNPVPGYNESVPMTDQSLPGRQVKARWRSGDPTLATSGGGFVNGNEWGALDGALAVAALKAGRVVFLTFDASGQLQRARAPQALQQYGRLRSVTVAARTATCWSPPTTAAGPT